MVWNPKYACAGATGTTVVFGVAIIVVTAIAVIAITTLLVDIMEKKQEAETPFLNVVELSNDVTDPAIWGENFPLHYDDYLKTVDMQETRFGGSEAMPRVPSGADPRGVVAESDLAAEPRLRTLWAGYPFAVDSRESRGHAYMLEDQVYTQRAEFGQAAACLNCHASTFGPYRRLGDGDLQAGFDAFMALPYEEARQHVQHPVACIDCHDPGSMRLRVTRPAFMRAIAEVKMQDGEPNYDVNQMASRQEMRSFVCAQCHSEYYFRGPSKVLTHPWSNGQLGDDILAYYEEISFSDWTHAETDAPMIKPQHPEFEMWQQGIHSRSGVACADCHMPYKRVGAAKISDHHVRSPLLNVNRACQTCHSVPEDELLARAQRIQSTTAEMRDRTLGAVIELIEGIQAAVSDGTQAEQIDRARSAQRRATWLLDFVMAENSTGFHAPQEAARLLLLAMDEARKGQVALGEDAATNP